MKKAEIYAAAAGHSPGYAWKWRCMIDKTHSRHAFLFYYDCVADAKEKGYEVELKQVKPIDL